MAEERGGESLSSLVNGIINDVRELFRQELALARAEIRAEVANARTAAVKVGVAAFVLLVGLLFVLDALARGLAVLTGWPRSWAWTTASQTDGSWIERRTSGVTREG